MALGRLWGHQTSFNRKVNFAKLPWFCVPGRFRRAGNSAPPTQPYEQPSPTGIDEEEITALYARPTSRWGGTSSRNAAVITPKMRQMASIAPLGRSPVSVKGCLLRINVYDVNTFRFVMPELFFASPSEVGGISARPIDKAMRFHGWRSRSDQRLAVPF